MTNEFFPKKGMVFFLEEPQKMQWFDNDTCYKKNRPYLVVSSNHVNEYSTCVQLVPVTTKPPKSGGRWWAVPLKRSNGTCQWVNILNCVCVPKTLCTEANRSESFAKDTEHNEEFLKRVDEALLQYFGISTPNTGAIETFTQPVAQNVCITADTQSITIPITLAVTLDVNTVMSQIKPTIITEAPATDTEPVIKEDTKEDTKEDVPTKKRTRPVFTEEQKKHIYEVVSECKALGGKLPLTEAAKRLGVSISTVHRYIKSLADGRFTDVHMTDFENKTLLKHLERSSVEAVYKYWKHKGFKSLEQFIEYCNYIRNK